jgi:hypothetical protein
MAVTPINIFIVLRDVKQFLRTNVSYIISLFWVLNFSLSTYPNPNGQQTNFIASNVVYYVDVDDHQKQVNGMMVSVVQWFGPLLIWFLLYFLNTMKNNLNTNTFISKIPLARPNGKKLETIKLKLNKSVGNLSRRNRPVQCSSSFWVPCLVIFALVLMPVESALCEMTDGSVANNGDCTCGNEECTTSRGLICYSTNGGGSCRKNDAGPFGYPRPDSGDCDDVAGRKSILGKAGCEAAATSLGLSDVVARELLGTKVPPGCFWYYGLRYNTLTTSTTSCSSDYSDYCLCLSAPNCLETDGATSNAESCFCGNTFCTIASGLHCYESDNFCSTDPPCTVTDGSIANIESCVCGNEECTTSRGLHCYAEASECTNTNVLNLCPIRDGSEINTAECKCGTMTCTESTGLICFSTIGGGSCRKTDLGGFGYPRPNSGNCDDVAGRKLISDQAACEAAATSLGLGVVVANFGSEFSSSGHPPGCYWGSNTLYYNTRTTSTYPCGSDVSDYCLCLSAPDCLETDGTTSNTAPCLCSNTICTIATGLHCYASENYCFTGPPCAVTDGSIANTEPCVCGNEECTTSRGLICYSTNGGGSCRKNDAGPFGYPRPTSGNCNAVAGRKSILDKATCEAAATSLGLSDVVAREELSSNYGCVAGHRGFQFN